jgi:hypothetical protein
MHNTPVYFQISAIHLNSAVKAAVDGIKFQEMRQCAHIREIINGYYGQIRAMQHSAKSQTSDAAEAIDSNFFHSYRE